MTGSAAELAHAVVGRFGGRYSSELGIDVDTGDAEVERWFVASTLFGTRISARVAERAYAQLERAGIRRITDAGSRQWQELVALLDAGGYARYDYRTATRLQVLAQVVTERYEGAISEMAVAAPAPWPSLRRSRLCRAGAPSPPGYSCGSSAACGPAPSRPWTHEQPRRRATWASPPKGR